MSLKEREELEQKTKEIFGNLPKNLDTLSKYLGISICTIVYGTGKSDFRECICTLNKRLIEKYTNSLGYEKYEKELYEKKYTESDKTIVVYDLIYGRRRFIPLGRKLWWVVNSIVISAHELEKLIEFVKKTWPKRTSISTKKKNSKIK